MGTAPESRRKNAREEYNVKKHTVQFEHRSERLHSYKWGEYLGIEYSQLDLRDGANALQSRGKERVWSGSESADGMGLMVSSRI